MPALGRRTTAALALALVGLGGVYTSAGLYRLVADVPSSFPIDLRLRWVESRLLAEGQNTQAVGHPDPLLSPVHEVMRAASGGYPPWAYAFGLLFVPPVTWTAARWWFAGINVAAMLWIALFAWRRARPHGQMPAIVAASLVFSNFSNAICLSYGQYGVLVLGLVALGADLLHRNRQPAAGLVLGLSLVKPQMSAAYCLALFVTRRWWTVVVIALTIGLGTFAMAALVGETPLAVLSRSVRDMGSTHMSSNPALNLATHAFGRSAAVLILGTLGAIAMTLIALRVKADPFRMAAASAIVAMFWTHRKHFDVAIMSLPLIWLWLEYVRTGRRQVGLAFAALGVTLWLPMRDAQWDLFWFQALQLVVWPLAAVVIVAGDPDPESYGVTGSRSTSSGLSVS